MEWPGFVTGIELASSVSTSQEACGENTRDLSYLWPSRSALLRKNEYDALGQPWQMSLLTNEPST